MNFISKKKIFLSFASISILPIAISCSTDNNSKNNGINNNSEHKKQEVRDILNDDFLNIDSNKKQELNTRLETANKNTVVDQILSEARELKNNSLKNKGIEQIKTYALDKLSNLRNLKNYEARITSESNKENLVDIIKEIDLDIKNQGQITDAEKEKATKEFSKLVDSNGFKEVSVFELLNTTPSFTPQQGHIKSEVLPTTFIKNISTWVAKIKPKYSWFLNSFITNARPEDSLAQANQKGELLLSIVFQNKFNENQQYTESYKISGFKSNSQGLDDDGTILTSSTERLKTPDEQYVLMNQKERFNADDSKYINVLKEQLRLNDWKELRKDAKNVTDEEIAKYNKEAEKVGLSSYESSALKGFSIPKYKSDGSFEGFSLNTERLIPMGPTWADALGGRSTFQIGGLGRRITNENYLNLAKQTYSVTFSNQSITELESERVEIQRNLKFVDHLSNFANNIKDQTTKDKYLKLINDAEGQQYYLEPYESQIWDIIAKETTDTHASDLYKKYLNEERNFYKEKVNNLKVREETKKLLNETIDNSNSFYNLDSLGNTGTSPSGTMWIMDYEEPVNGQYPTKFYFGTNLHVADSIAKNKRMFSGIGLTRLNGDNNGILNNFKLMEMEVENGTFTQFTMNPETVRRVFDGRDYLKSSPSEFITSTQKEIFKDAEEFLDFAVIEIDFGKIQNNRVSGTGSFQPSSITPQNFAKWVTNDYANWEEKDKTKFKSESYLKNYKKIEFPLATKGNYDWSKLDQIFALGYPKSISSGFQDYFLKPYIDDDQRARAEWSHSLWTNADHKFYDLQATEDGPQGNPELLKRGNFLSYNIGFRSFAYKPGLTDAFLAAPLVGDKPDPKKNIYVSTDDNKKYINFGLEYLPRWFTPGVGASGSSLRTQNNEVVAIYHATNASSNTGLAAAFRSEGFDYGGMFGKYTLPQYDLIYGGGKDQKNSYREAMKKLFEKGEIKNTHLFKNGFDNIPKGFEFKETNGFIKSTDLEKEEGKNE
ncbi:MULTISPECIES: Ig-specific serine endopeptidase MIP [unclassified Mycoplasma]|uniref:Ig-specific serine endopeptidase MIP n=1 Tax=unclassified Mycoplasma TaxID=2683645 RepID=UPI00197C2D0D|nr:MULTISPECIES: DUF31 family protein [unclassified Mycoplasma]MBN4084457.1 DUF31 family protein [Mycoplasma sp. CSL10166]MCU4706570.1 DUF31 family protein [Mycoplasma sp. CSL7503-lung]